MGMLRDQILDQMKPFVLSQDNQRSPNQIWLTPGLVAELKAMTDDKEWSKSLLPALEKPLDGDVPPMILNCRIMSLTAPELKFGWVPEQLTRDDIMAMKSEFCRENGKEPTRIYLTPETAEAAGGSGDHALRVGDMLYGMEVRTLQSDTTELS